MARSGLSRLSWPALSGALLCLALLLVPAIAHSEDNSTPPESLWSTLLQASNGLPQLMDDYAASWTKQVDELLISNARLQALNASLTQQNADLQSSLEASRQELATSEAERLRLQNSLQDSMQSITQAKTEAEKLIAERNLWRIGAIAGGVIAVIATIAAVVK